MQRDLSIAFVFHSDALSGNGHLSRCFNILTILRSLSDRSSISVTHILPQGVTPSDQTRSFPGLIPVPYQRISRSNDFLHAFDFIVVDTYLLAPSSDLLLRNLLNSKGQLIRIDDLCLVYPYADIVINQNEYLKGLYSPPDIPGQLTFVGHQYALLHPAFLQHSRVQQQDNLCTIYLGQNPVHSNIISEFASQVSSSMPDVDFILFGNLFPDFKSPPNLDVKPISQSYIHYSLLASMSITSGGVSLLERLAVSHRTVAFSTADNQADVSKQCSLKYGVLYLGSFPETLTERTTTTVSLYLRDKTPPIQTSQIRPGSATISALQRIFER